MEGYEHVEKAAKLLKAVVKDLFALPGAAQRRATEERERLGEANHGDDLLCGCWEAAETATALLELSGRHVDGVVYLADGHPAFAPSAAVLARAALDCLLRVTWLLGPADARDREQRWLALKREEARFWKNAGFCDSDQLNARLAELDGIAAAIGGTAVVGTPSSEALAKEYGRRPMLYDFLYRWNSQAMHGTLVGAGTFEMNARQEWNELGGEGEWVEAEFWGMPLAACWEGASVALPAYRNLLAPEQPLPGLDHEDEFARVMRSLPPNYQARRDAARVAEIRETSAVRQPGSRAHGVEASRTATPRARGRGAGEGGDGVGGAPVAESL